MTRTTFSAAATLAALVALASCGGSRAAAPPEVPDVSSERESQPRTSSAAERDATPGDAGQNDADQNDAGQNDAGQSATSQAAARVSEAEVEEFSDLQVQMFDVVEDLHARAIEGEDPAALEAELEMEANRLVEQSSLSVPRFQEIAILVLEVPELRARVEESVRQKVERAQVL